MGDDEQKDTARPGPLVPASPPVANSAAEGRNCNRRDGCWRSGVRGDCPRHPGHRKGRDWAVKSWESERTQRTGGRLGDRAADH